MPYAILASTLPQHKLGIYMGLFNVFVVVPQLLVATVMGSVMKAFFPGEPIWTMAFAGAVPRNVIELDNLVVRRDWRAVCEVSRMEPVHAVLEAGLAQVGASEDFVGAARRFDHAYLGLVDLLHGLVALNVGATHQRDLAVDPKGLAEEGFFLAFQRH